MKSIDKFKGCLIGGAAGDALGYPVEFLGYDNIVEKYGNSGITKFKLYKNKALISDDTQMTLFTAGGLLSATECAKVYGIFKSDEKYIYESYQDWYHTQYSNSDDYKPHNWLYDIEDLHSRRAPGITCTSSLEGRIMGTLKNRINNSNGCGGVMRVAPIGLYLTTDRMDLEQIFLFGGKVAALTHGGDNAIIPACVFTYIINQIIYSRKSLETIITESLSLVEKNFKKNSSDYFLLLMNEAIELSKNDKDDYKNIRRLGLGWHGHEALAISTYCALKYQDDFEKGIIAAVNHDGDSDSTGSITGNILGAYLGIDKIPNYYIDKLELKDVILTMATDLSGEGKELNKRYALK